MSCPPPALYCTYRLPARSRVQKKGVGFVTDNEKRAHDLAIVCMPLAMVENNEKCFNFPVPEFESMDVSNNHAIVNPHIAEMYLKLYSAFADQLPGEPGRNCR